MHRANIEPWEAEPGHQAVVVTRPESRGSRGARSIQCTTPTAYDAVFGDLEMYHPSDSSGGNAVGKQVVDLLHPWSQIVAYLQKVEKNIEKAAAKIWAVNQQDWLGLQAWMGWNL